ncbi:MAG: phage tail tape measure protein [Oscillospiraceae bacterium]|nr:phage tail tape measure protein [Oscillospiraceae bacterium]
MATKSQLTKGITIPIGGDATSFNSAISEVNSSLTATGKEVSALKSSLKLEFDDDKFKQAQDAAQWYLEETRKKADYLREAIKQVSEGNDPKKNEQLQYLNTELQYAENAAKRAENQLNDLNKIRFGSIQNSFKDTNKEIDITKEKTELLRDRLDIKIDKNTVAEFQKAAQEQIDKTNEKLLQMKQVMADIASADPNAAATKEFKELENQVISLENEVVQAAKSIKEVNKIRLDEINEQFQKAGDNIAGIGKAISPVSLAVSGAIGVGVKAAIDFEQAMSKVESIIGSTGAETELLKTKIRDMSEVTVYSATNIANSAKMVAESGGDVNLMMEQLEQGANLATATQSDLAMTLDFLGSTVKSFKVDAEDIRAAVDSITTVTTKANLELLQLAESYKNIGDSAAKAGLDINDTNALLIMLSENGHKGGTAGTELSGVLRNLSTPTQKAKDELNALNIELYEGGKQRDILTVADELTKKLATLDEESRNAAESVIFDTVSLKAWNVITGEGIDSVKELSDELSKSSEAFGGIGQAAGMAAELTGTTTGRLQILKNQIENLGASFGELLLPTVQKLTGGVSDFVKWLNSLDDSTKNNILRIGLFVAALAPALTIMGNITKGISSLITQISIQVAAHEAQKVATDAATIAQTNLNVAMSANPIGIVVTAIGVLVGVLGAMGLAGALTTATDKTSELNKKLEENKNVYESAKKSIEDNKNAQEAELDKVERLIPQYEELNKKVDKTSEEKERLKIIVEEINRILPGAIKLINEETGAYDTQNLSIQDLIKNKRKLIESKMDEDKASALISYNRNLQTTQTETQSELDTTIRDYISKYGGYLTEKDKRLIATGQFDWNKIYDIAPINEYGTFDEKNYGVSQIDKIINLQSTIKDAAKKINDNNAEIDKLLESSFDTQAVVGGTGGNSGGGVDNAPANMAKKEYDQKIALIEQEKAKKIISAEEANEQIWKINNAYYEKGSTELIRAETQYYSTKISLSEKSAKDTFDIEMAGIKNSKTQGLLTERESLDKIYALKQAYYKDDEKALLDAQTEYLTGIENLNKKSEQKKSSTSKSDKTATSEKEKTPEELYKDEKNRQDLVFNAQKEGDRDYEQHLQNRIELRDKYLQEDSDEWLRATAEINSMQSALEKKKEDDDKKAADIKLKNEKDNYDKGLQQFKDDLEDRKITWQEYYDGLVKLKQDNADYLSREDNDRIARSLNKEIEKALSESQKDIITVLKKNYADGLIDFQEFIQKYKEYADEFYSGNEETLTKAYDDIAKITAGYATDEMSKIQKMYNDELISFDDYIRQYLAKAAELYGADSEQYKKAEQTVTNSKEQKYREEKEYKDWLRSMGVIDDKQYYDDMLKLAAEYLDKDSKLWREAMLAQYSYKRSEAEKERKAYEDDLRKRQKALDDNLKSEEKAIEDQKKEIERRYKEELKTKQDAIKQAYDDRVKAIDKELDAEKFRLSTVIAGINDEIKKRRELREDEGQDDKIARARKALEAAVAEAEFERDDFTKQNLEQEVIRRREELDKLLQERDDTVFNRAKEAEKTAVQEQIKTLEDNAKSAKEAAKIEMEAALLAAEATDELNARLQELDDKLAEIRDRYEQHTAAINEMLNAQTAEVNTMGMVVSAYDEMSGKTGEAAGKKEELTEAVKNLDTKLLEFIPKLSEETTLYEKQAAALKEIIAAKEQLAALAQAEMSAINSAPSGGGGNGGNTGEVPYWSKSRGEGEVELEPWAEPLNPNSPQTNLPQHTHNKVEVDVNITHSQTAEQFEKTLEDRMSPFFKKMLQKTMGAMP